MQITRRTFLFTLVFLVLAGAVVASAQSSALQFLPIAPCRVVDTRITGNPIQGGTSQNFPVQGSQGTCNNIPTSAAAYSLNVTVVPRVTLGYLTVWPAGQPRPAVSTLNSLDGRVKGNAAIVTAGSIGGGAVSVYATNTTDVVLDVNGYFAPPTGSTQAFYPVTPCRIADTRHGQILQGRQEADFPVSGMCGIPSSATAYSLNFTVVPQSTLGYLTVWPAGQPKPVVSTLNSLTGTIVANAAMVGAGSGGQIAVYPSDNTNLIIDINGYYAPAGSSPGGLSLYTLTPCRILDTRDPGSGGAFSGTIPVNDNPAGSTCAIPGLAQALVLNATVVPPRSLGYLTLWANGQARPLTSTLNAVDGAITSNMAVTPTTNGFVNAYATNSTQLVLDGFSYFAVPGALSGNYTFSYNGFNNGNEVFMVGSFVADGNGNIIGVLDQNSASGPPRANVSFRGTYAIQPNGLGSLSITTTLNGPFDFSVAVASTGNATMILNNDSNQPNSWGSGVIKLQNPAAFSLPVIAGNYASGFVGVDYQGNRLTGAGAYQIVKNISAYQLVNHGSPADINDNGSPGTQNTTGGNLQAPDPNTGRGTTPLIINGVTTHWIYYVTSANDLTFLSIDPISSPANVVLQSMLRQATSTFDNSSLKGGGVIATSGISQTMDKKKEQGPGSVVSDIVVGLLTTDGAGNGAASIDQNDGGTITQQQTSQGTYSVGSNGRVTLTGFGSNNPPIFYLMDKNQGFIVGQDSAVAAGYLEAQSGGPFSNASAIGTYWGGSITPTIPAVPVSVSTVFADANGNLSGTQDTSGSGGTGTQGIAATYQVDSTGRMVITENGGPVAILYVVSPTKAALLPISASDTNTAWALLGSTN